MFSIQICRYSNDLRSLRWWKSVKFIKIKAPRKSGDWALTKNLAGGQDLPNFEDLSQGYQGEGIIMLGID